MCWVEGGGWAGGIINATNNITNTMVRKHVVLGLGGGPLWSQMGDIVWVDTDEIG